MSIPIEVIRREVELALEVLPSDPDAAGVGPERLALAKAVRAHYDAAKYADAYALVCLAACMRLFGAARMAEVLLDMIPAPPEPERN